MTAEREPRPPLEPQDARLVRIIARHYAPAPLDAARAAAFDARLRERLARRRRLRLVPPLVAAAAAASLAALVVVRGMQDAPPPDPASARVARAQAGVERVDPAWERAVLYAEPAQAGLDEDDVEGALPPEYAAIDALFLGS